jgi:hypothetical protein
VIGNQNKQPKLVVGQHVMLTPRDVEILRFTCRHGIVTVDQLSRRFFKGKRNAYRRVALMVRLGLMRRDRWAWSQPEIIRATRSAVRLVNSKVGPATLILSQVAHCLAVVDLVDELEHLYPGAALTTERELAGERHRALQDGTRALGRGRMPDALLTLDDGRTVGLELDLTPKRSREFARLVRAYGAEHLDCIKWYLPSQRCAERLRAVVEKEFAGDRIEVLVRPR